MLCIGGRLEAGIGVGHRVKEDRAFGMNPSSRPSRMEEAIELLKLGWADEWFSYAGRYYQLEEVRVQPAPVQRPYAPLWVAATTSAAAERAGRHGANFAAVSVDEDIHRAYHDALTMAGHLPGSTR